MLDKQIFVAAVGDGMPVSLANLIVAQAKHESGDFTSKVFKNDNNLFGYKYVGQAGSATKGTLSPEKDFYAHYNTIEDSVHEITRWIKRRAKQGVFPSDLTTIKTPEDYAKLLKKAGYYGDSLKNYTAGLQRHFQDYSI